MLPEKSNRTLLSLLGVLVPLSGVYRKLSSTGVGGGACGEGSAPCILNSGRLRLGDGCARMAAETRAVRSEGGRAMKGVTRGVILRDGFAGRRLRSDTGLIDSIAEFMEKVGRERNKVSRATVVDGGGGIAVQQAGRPR